MQSGFEIKIKAQKENPLLNRTEIFAEILHERGGTPTRAQVRRALAAALSVDQTLLVIRKLEGTFGGITRCFANLYKTSEGLEKIELKHILKREAGKKKEK